MLGPASLKLRVTDVLTQPTNDDVPQGTAASGRGMYT